MKRGFVEAPPIQQNPPQYHLDHRVGIVQGRRATGVIVRKTLGLIPLVPRLTAPFVEMRQREACVGAPVRRIGLEGAFEVAACLSVCFDSPALQTLEASQPAVVCVQARQRRTLGRSQPGSVDADLQRAGNLFCNLVLHCEQRSRGDVVAIGPELAPRVGVEQLDPNADHVAGSTDTAAQEVGSVRSGVAATASWRRCRERLGVHDFDCPEARKGGGNVLHESQRQHVLRGIARQVLKRSQSDAGSDGRHRCPNRNTRFYPVRTRSKNVATARG